ncbi:MAG TPA: hypothetical protein VM925_29110, partial [Labilithrix sp.]|nr:hypothetical protein [Labilithrix sp.]
MKRMRWVWSSTLLIAVVVGQGCGAEGTIPNDPNAGLEPVSGTKDAGGATTPDAGVDADGGSKVTHVPCVPTGNPTLLSQTCLYSNIAKKEIDPDSLSFEPAYALWTDGAVKRRWVRLPGGSKIDTSDMDHWQFPVGTRVFKEFSLDGKLLETRMIERVGPGEDASAYSLVSFVWQEDSADAVLNTAGAANVLGTNHDVPSQKECDDCHKGEAGRVLGFSAVQLSTPGPGLSLAALVSRGWFSVNPPAGASYPAPGNATEAAAFGYLHANCGHCHNPNGMAFKWTNVVLRLSVSETTATATQIHATTVNVGAQLVTRRHLNRVVPKEPGSSD